MDKRVIDGRFELVERLGGGGMGLVWRAWDVALHREVALKEVRPPDPAIEEHDPTLARELRSRVLREARALARLNHPHVATIHHIVDPGEQGYPWIVMELVTGGSLQDLLQHGPLPVREAARLGREVLSGLRAAHAVGIQHRDVKPANVLLREDGRSVLTDFGIAAMRESTSLTATGSFIGSPEYMAPERINGVEGDPASDLWSLGMMLYVAVEGRHPLRRGTTLATLAAVLNQDVPPAERGGALGPVLGALLVREPSARPDPETLDRMLAEAEAGRPPALPGPYAGGPATPQPMPPGPAFPGPATPQPMPSGPAFPGPAPSFPGPAPAFPPAGYAGQTGPSASGFPPGGQTVPPGYGKAPQQPPWGRGPVQGADTAHTRRSRRGARGAVVAVSASAVAIAVVAAVLVWQSLPPATAGRDGDPRSTSLSLGNDPTEPADDPAEEPTQESTEEPTEEPAEKDLLTPAGMRGMIAKLKPVIGGTRIVRMTIHPTHASVDVPRKDDPEVFDSYDYRDGEVTGPRTGRTFDTPLVDLATFNWNALPNLLKKAKQDLGARAPISHHMIVEPDYSFTSTKQVLLVYASDTYSRGGYLVASPQGKVLKVVS
ncbi:serine/threonine protein kinase [Nonomuraea thailandensis]|uniref:non-specific serine/threonine protein kinase n=1 Tax=Nonomuraea thailandensis TaxID=1188745 RepID=A0A9X2K9T3_9ACTN|nr:serine/threonine-protein kinase [Nonomuraea thailandensis]MCP2365080.1 serine/threonine protein kinase [Nonomuraea thailandensis]